MEFIQNLTWGCWWDIPVLILLIAATVWFCVARKKLKKEKKELQDQVTK